MRHWRRTLVVLVAGAAITAVALALYARGHATANREEFSLQLSPNRLDFGHIDQDATVKGHVLLKNAGVKPISIQAVHVNCGCAVAEIPTGVLAPGATVPLDIEFRGTGYFGDVTKYAYVECNAPIGIINIPIHAYVKVGFRADRANIDFGRMRTGERKEGAFRLYRDRGDDRIAQEDPNTSDEYQLTYGPWRPEGDYETCPVTVVFTPKKAVSGYCSDAISLLSAKGTLVSVTVSYEIAPLVETDQKSLVIPVDGNGRADKPEYPCQVSWPRELAGMQITASSVYGKCRVRVTDLRETSATVVIIPDGKPPGALPEIDVVRVQYQHSEKDAKGAIRILVQYVRQNEGVHP